MADTAFQTQYRQEFVAGFEQRQSLLRDTVTTEYSQTRGNAVVFLVADSGGAEAQNRGVSGLIPARADNLTQNTCTLQEWHDLVRKSGFNIFASQSDQRRIMQESTMATLNRKIDRDIVDQLDSTTLQIGTAAGIPTIDLVQQAQVKLQNAQVPWDSNITLLCTPAFMSYLEQAPEFAKATYVPARPWAGSDENANWRDQPMMYRWKNMGIISHPKLPVIGTTGEQSYMYHKSAVGHACNTTSIDTAVGYDEENDYSFARATIYCGSKLLQNSGVIEILSDGSARA